jgi:arylsulfatase A-like enzyme
VLLGNLTLAAASAPPPAPSPRPRHLVLVSIDTLRADHLGCYGYGRPTSPAIDAIAREGVVFEDASATSPWTKPSHASLLTGLFPGRNGATTMESLLRHDVAHLASLLSGHGFETSAIVNSRWLTSHGLERGFRHFKSIDYIQGRRESSPVTETVAAWLATRDRAKRLFLFVHYMDVHSDYMSLPEYEQMFVGPYSGPITGSTQQLYRVKEGVLDLSEPDVRHLRALYDAGIRQVDARLGQLFAHLGREGLLAESLVVITADHGEEFLEHGGVIHGFTQYQEVIRVPLIFRGPGIPGNIRVRAPVSLVDIMPTCLGLLGLPAPARLDGVAVDRLWRDPRARLDGRLLYFEADVTFPPPRPGAAPPGPHRAVRNERFKLHRNIRTGETALYDLLEDPGERINVKAKHPGVAAELLGQLKRYLEGQSEPASLPLTERELEALKALGYIGGK